MINLRIAGFDYQINECECNLPISFPICHEKFIQPVEQTQGVFFDSLSSISTGPTNKLSLQLHCKPLPFQRDSDTLLIRNVSWELRRDEEGNMTFVSPSESPPSQVTVTPDFTRGEVLVDLSNFSKKSFYPLSNLESRLFSAWLASTGDFIMHASGVSVDGEGYCFLGDSGAGKSTLASILAQEPGVTVLGEDQVILRYLAGRFWIFGTPWHQNPHMCSPLGVQLKKMFFLDRSLPPGTITLEPVEGVTRLLQIAIIPYHLPQRLPAILDRLSLLAEQIPFISLSYQLGTDPWFSINNA